MNLGKKKILAIKALKVGKERIAFLKSRLSEIKEAITKQDIRDLHKEGAIIVKEVKGKRKNLKRKRKRSTGKIKKKINKRKQEYVIMTRKLRKYTAAMKEQSKITREEKIDIRKKIRNRMFKSLAYLKNHIKELKK